MKKYALKIAALCTAITLLLAGCAGIPVPPGASGAPTGSASAEASVTPADTVVKIVRTEAPRPAAEEPGEFSVVLTFNDSIGWGNYFSALEKLLGAKGVKAYFFEEPWDGAALSSGGFDFDLYAQQAENAIKAEVAAGKAADGYIVQKGLGRKLLADGVTQDLASVLRQSAPTYVAENKDLFKDGAAALPLDLSDRSMDEGIALAMGKDEAAKASGVKTVEGLLAILASGNSLKVYAEPPTLLKAWAINQGYYALADCGVGGMLYARTDDKACAPVPVEDIPGFDAFAAALRAAIVAGQIALNPVDPDTKAPDGAVGEGYALDNIAWALNGDASQYVLFPLACYNTLSVRAWSYELAVPAASKKAADVAKFMEWIASSPDNYLLVNYGEQGRDFRLDNGALTLLLVGKPYAPADLDPDQPYLPRDNPGFFKDSALEPLPAALPQNYKEAVAAAAPLTPPIWGIAAVRGADDPSTLFDVTRYTDLISRREALVVSLFQNDDGTPATDEQSAPRLAQLRAMSADTAKLAGAVGEQIKKLVGG